MTLSDGSGIVIEQRSAQEVTHIQSVQTGPDGVAVYNPAFDVTPHTLLTGIITEGGILYPPFSEGLKKLITAAE
jgi:methylthioribose-1-phosphate isomerase